MKSSLPFVTLLAGLVPPASALTLSCPDLATAVQVGACPGEEELRHTYSGYCGDDAKAYRGETDVCTDYRRYRALKNVALWEAADGAFSAYVSCDRPAEEVRAATLSAVRLGKQGKITQLVCSYGVGLGFTLRTRSECRLEADCKDHPASCKASCD